MQHSFFQAVSEFLTRKLRHSYPRASQQDIEDAIGNAVEQYLTTAPQHVRSCEQRSRAWLFTTAWRSLRRDHVRRSRHLALDLEASIEQPHPIQADHLTKGLSVRSRAIVHLHSFEGLKPREIAGALGCSVNAVNLHLRRAYRALRSSLKHDYAVLRESYHFWVSAFKLGHVSEWAMTLSVL